MQGTDIHRPCVGFSVNDLLYLAGGETLTLKAEPHFVLFIPPLEAVDEMS